MKKRVAGIVLTTVAVSGLGLGAAGLAFAEPTTGTSTPSATASTDTGQMSQDQMGQGMRGHRGGMGDREGDLAAQLAEKLGVDQAKVTTMLEEIRASHEADHKAQFTTRLDQAVTDGKLTRAEADAVLKAAEAGVIGMGGGPR